MRKNRKIAMSVILAGIITTIAFNAGCGKSKTNDKKADTDEIVALSDKEQDEIYDKLFDIDSKITIKMDMSDEEIAKIQEDYNEYSKSHSKSPIYRKADKVTFIIDDKEYTVKDVGVRMKGNTSRTDFYNLQSGKIYNLINLKFSFNETFDNKDYYGKDVMKWSSKKERTKRKNRRFAGLKKLELKANKNEDQTFVRQYYSYEMFRDNGVPAPRSNIAQLCNKDTNYGVFLINEPVDKIFVNRNFSKDDRGGDLYKAKWTYAPANYTKVMTYGCSDNEEGEEFNLDLKTNKSKSKNEKLEKLLDVINNDASTEDDILSVIDKDNWIKFCAVSYFTGNPDDFRNNYNNHYVYFTPEGKAYFIPYDYDRCLGITKSWNPEMTGMTETSPFSENAEGNGSKQSNPLIKKTILEGGCLISEYKDELERIATGEWMKIDNFNAVYEKAKNNYDSVSVPDESYQNIVKEHQKFSLDGELIFGDDSTNMSVEEYFEGIMKSYDYYKQ